MSNLFYGKVQNGQVLFEKEEDFALFLEANKGRKVYIDIGFETKKRTPKQNNALWLGCTQLADALNLSGLEMAVVLSRTMRAPWTKDSVADGLIRPLMKAEWDKKSTTELEKQQIDEIWSILMRELGEKFNFEYLPFPSIQTKNETLSP